MPLELKFTFPLANGLHARPASVFRDAASQFTSTMTLANRQNNATANAKSTLALVATLTKQGDSCSLLIEGNDEQSAFDSMLRFIDSNLPHCDDVPASLLTQQPAGTVPRALKTDGVLVYEGTPVSKGIIHSRAFVADSRTELPDISQEKTGTIAEELAKIDRAFSAVAGNLQRRLAASNNKTQQEIVRAHLAIVEDVEFKDKVLEQIRSGGISAGAAVKAATEYFASILQQAESVYLRERILDIKDIASQILREMYSLKESERQSVLDNDGVWICENMSPSQFISINKSHLKGIVLAHGGTTSHTVILARAFGIPCLTGVKDVHLRLHTGQDILVDAERGLIVPDPPANILAFYRGQISKLETFKDRLAKFKDVAGATADGKRLEVGANVGSLEEAEAAFRNGAEGIGLFRTELLFMNRPEPPTEDEQFRVYSETARIAGKRSVIIRTLDIGGDKPIPYLNLPVEANPFLGFRAIRMYDAHQEIIETQLRAILRASVFGNLKIMIPMVSSVDEVKHVRAWLGRVLEQLDRAQIQFNRTIEIGIMVEVPSVAFIIDQLSREVDFFSIGSNDLTQYFLAVDRDNEKVGHLYSSFHPSFVRLMKKIIDDAHAHGKWIGLCGELGSNRLAVPLFVGYGIDELSLASPDIAMMKSAIGLCRSSECEKLLASVLEKESPSEVEMSLKEFWGSRTDRSLTAKEMILLDSKSRTKEEAIRELVDLLHLADRIDDADSVEETIWQREATYSTGVGFGVAIPHCKSPNVLMNSIAILKVRSAIDWKSLDDEPVKLVILIAIKGDKASEEHLKMIAGLSRKLMDENFRERIMAANEKTKMLALLNNALTL